MKEIDLLEWDITYSEFVTWTKTTGAVVYASATIGANDPRTRYYFEKDEDLSIFKLTFQKERRSNTFSQVYQ